MKSVKGEVKVLAPKKTRNERKTTVLRQAEIPEPGGHFGFFSTRKWLRARVDAFNCKFTHGGELPRLANIAAKLARSEKPSFQKSKPGTET
jgi:hypothetical protein